MGRRGMVTIGVAVQAETFSNSNNPSPVPNLDPSSVFSSSSKSTIFLPPNKDGTPQTLRITFTYNKDTNLPEIVVNLDGEDREDKYLQLKDLCRGNATGLETRDAVTSPQFIQSNQPDERNKGKEVQVCYFNEIKMDSENGRETTTPVVNLTKTNPDENITSPTAKKTDPKKCDKKCAEQTSKSDLNYSNEIQTEKRDVVDRKTSKSRTSETGGIKSKSSKQRTYSPTKDINDKSRIPVINSTATGYMSCEYYRKKLLHDVGCTDFASTCWTPNYFNSIKKTAGQKVVNKLTAQQKELEQQAQAAQRKRTEFVFHEELGFCEVPEKLPLKKKQIRLEPLRTVPSSCY